MLILKGVSRSYNALRLSFQVLFHIHKVFKYITKRQKVIILTTNKANYIHVTIYKQNVDDVRGTIGC